MPPVLPPPDPNKDPLNPLYSAFFITINSNSAKGIILKPFKKAWENVTEKLIEFLVLRPGGELLEVRERHEFERGPVYHRIHCHSRLILYTTGLVFIDKDAIRDYISDFIRDRVPEYQGCYVHYDLVKNFNASRYLEEYISKAPIPQIEFL